MSRELFESYPYQGLFYAITLPAWKVREYKVKFILYPFTPLCSIPRKRLPSLAIQRVPVHAPIQYTP
jgi:hypothetical protein